MFLGITFTCFELKILYFEFVKAFTCFEFMTTLNKLWRCKNFNLFRVDNSLLYSCKNFYLFGVDDSFNEGGSDVGCGTDRTRRDSSDLKNDLKQNSNLSSNL